MLRKEDSNKLLKGIKAVVFATSLTFLSSIQTEAQEVKQEIKQEEINPDTLMLNVCIGGAILVSLSLGYYIYVLTKDNKDQLHSLKLADDTNIEDEVEITRQIKIICK